MRLALFVLAVGAASLVAGPTSAQRAVSAEQMTEARHSFEVATLAFENGDYEGAAFEFTAAYEITRHPDLLFNIYLAQERAGRLEQARQALERYLAEGEPEADQRSILERRLGRLEARIAVQEASPESPQAAPPAMPDEAQMLDMLRAAAATLAAPQPRVDTGPSWAAIGTLVAAGVLGVSFGVFAGLSEAEDQSLAASCGRDAGAFCDEQEVATLSLYNTLADVSWVSALVLGVVGVVFIFALPPEQAPAPGDATPTAAIMLTPYATTTGAGLAAIGSF